MQLREALLAAQTATIDAQSKVALACSFEPLHLTTYLQALLAQAHPSATPEVVRFGYDQLIEALRVTGSDLARVPTLLFLTWEDLHPALSWRSRSALSPLAHEQIEEGRCALERQLHQWLSRRSGAESYIMVAPMEWLPILDATSPLALGESTLAAMAAMHSIVDRVAMGGARILRTPSLDLNLRDLLGSGCPLYPADSEKIARAFVSASIRKVERKKVIVTDLDNTLWKGIIGEVGSESIQHLPEGKGHAHHLFQKFLKKLSAEGVVLAFCSKNNEADVIPFFDGLNMPLSLANFATYRCNWATKSENIRSIAQELNVGLDSVVFIDDSQAELAEVRAYLPDVLVYEVPQTGEDWRMLFHELQDQFFTWHVNDEDRLRTASFKSESNRRKITNALDAAGQPVGATGIGYLRSFDLRFTLCTDAFSDPRSLDLINKTNQFNLSGERIEPAEWLRIHERSSAMCWSAHLEDRYGSFGTIAVLVAEKRSAAEVFIRQFVLSCRAFGRGVEHTMLLELAQRTGCRTVRGVFRATAKNEPAHRFLTDMGVSFLDSDEWVLDASVVRDKGAAVVHDTGIVVMEQ